MKLRLAHLYPKLMNIYGDRGNIMALRHRCEARGIEFELTELEMGDKFDAEAYDMAFMGGAQDVEQRRVAEDFRTVKGAALRAAAEEGFVFLAVCGGYQLAGHYYRGFDGGELRGAGILDLHTVHPGPQAKRFIGNVVVEWNGAKLVGFENHGGRTYLGAGAQPFARIVTGNGNSGDGWEGAVYRNTFGTYLHGSLLPKNPRFTDHLLTLALGRRYSHDVVGESRSPGRPYPPRPHPGRADLKVGPYVPPGRFVVLEPLDDTVEDAAHAEALRLSTRRSIMRMGGRR